jgi:hypothetical protein
LVCWPKYSNWSEKNIIIIITGIPNDDKNNLDNNSDYNSDNNDENIILILIIIGRLKKGTFNSGVGYRSSQKQQFAPNCLFRQFGPELTALGAITLELISDSHDMASFSRYNDFKFRKINSG